MDYLQYFISSLLYCVKSISRVLNLIINGLPSIQNSIFDLIIDDVVLNLIINGLPSILYIKFIILCKIHFKSFKPYYKWITFNTISKIFTCS